MLAHGGRGWWYDAAAFMALAARHVWIELSGLPPKRLPEYYPRYDLGRLARKWIFATDWPGVPGHAGNARAVVDLGLDDDVAALVLGGNALRVYAGLEPPPTSTAKEDPDLTYPSSRADYLGRPARELCDDELEQQGKNAHDTRNWVFLHGTAEQFATHTARMLELEQEYLRRYPKRTWQGSGGAPTEESEAASCARRCAAILVQLEALLEPPPPRWREPRWADDPSTRLLRRIAARTGGRMNKLEVHQLAREVGLDRAALARLYNGDAPLLSTEKQDRVITDAGRAALG